jgi:hypothetical protein
MKAIVVYESHWGNTAAVAGAIAEGIGPDAHALDTDSAIESALGGVDLIVAGAPVIAFSLPRESMKAQIATDTNAQEAPDISHPLLRAWLDRLATAEPSTNLRHWGAAFETRIWWSPRGATGTIESKLKRAGYQRLAKGERFIVAGAYGPLKDGELERARAWGAELASLVVAKG